METTTPNTENESGLGLDSLTPVPENVAEIYMVRHGTTTLNVQNRYRGRRDVPLDAQGWADAVEAAKALSPVGLAAVYAGPLRRTINTAQVIADECRVPDVRILHGLVNLDYGEWEGMTSAEAAMYDPEMFRLYKEDPDNAICPNGERLTDGQKRIVEAIQLMGERHRGERVAGVTHAVMIRLVAATILRLPGADWRIPIGRGSLTRFEVEDGNIRLVGMPDGDDVD
jgi:broad specificity phosphatase PhoE